MHDELSVNEWLKDKFLSFGNIKASLPQYKEVHLFSSEISLCPRQLIDLIYDIEDYFNIQFSENDFICERIYKFSGLIQLILAKSNI